MFFHRPIGDQLPKWRRPTVTDVTSGGPIASAPNAIDGGATPALDSSTYAQLNCNGGDAKSVTWSGMAGTGSVAGVLHINLAYGTYLGDDGYGHAALGVSYSTNGGGEYTQILGLVDSQDQQLLTDITVSLTAVPADIRVKVTASSDGWDGSYSNCSVFDIVFVVT
jgi:hypothetical protein